MAKRKRSPLEIAKDNAWDAFSRFIRTRDCIKYGGDPESGICVTCKRPYPFKKLQAGHFIAGRTNAILLDEDLVHTQCYGCNMGRSGAHVEYFVFMEQTYGRETIDIFRARKSISKKMRKEDWDEEILYWKSRTAQLLQYYNSNKYSQEMSHLLELGKTLKKTPPTKS